MSYVSETTVPSTSCLAGRLNILVPNNFNIYTLPRKQTYQRTLLYLSYYQHMGEEAEGRLVRHLVRLCRTAAALQMRLTAQIIVSYGGL